MAERPVLNPREIVAQGRNEARAMGSSRVEAEHLLLALASRPETSAGRLLTAVGLDHEGVREALDLEFERSLGAVGILLHGFCLPEERLPVVGGLRLARSAKLAFERAIKLRGARHDRGFDHLHLLVGIVSAEGGTVARALDVAGVDRTALTAQARTLLDRAA